MAITREQAIAELQRRKQEASQQAPSGLMDKQVPDYREVFKGEEKPSLSNL